MGEYDYIARGDELYDRLRSASKAKAVGSSGYLGTFGKGFKSELTMGYGVSDEPPRLEGIGEKVAYGAGALAGMIPSFVALSTVTTPLGSAALKVGRLGRLINSLHKMGKVYKIADKAGKVKDVSKLGMAVEGAAKSGALFAAHGAAHELPPGEEGALARVKAGAEAVPMGMAFGAAAPLAGGRRLAQIGTAAGIGAGATAISGGTTEDILIQGGLLGAMSAMHISVKDAHSFAKQIAGEVDKLPTEQRQARIDEVLGAAKEDMKALPPGQGFGIVSEGKAPAWYSPELAQKLQTRALYGPGMLGEQLRYARDKSTTPPYPTETDLIREDRLSFAQERAKDQPMGVPGDLPATEKSRLPGRGVVLGEEPRSVSELLTAEGRPVSEAAEHERIVGALDTEGALRDAIQAVKIRDLKRQEGLIEVPGATRRPAGPEVAVRGAFGMRARPEPLVEPAGVPGERFVEARETPEQIEARRLEAEKPERILPQTVDEARIAEEDAAVTQKIIEASREERDFAKGQKIREEFYEEAAKKGNAAQASDIIGGGVDRLIDDIGKKRITEKDALSLYEEAVKRNIAIPEKLDEFKRKIKKVSELKVVSEEKPKVEGVEIPEFTTTEDALAFGKTATPQQTELMKTKRDEILAKTEEKKARGEASDMAELMRGSYLREAIQSSEGKIVEPEFKPKVEKPAVEVPPIKEEIPAEPVKPEPIAIPELKNTEDALVFGKTATPEQIEVLKAKQNESQAKSDALKEKGDLQGAMDEAFRGQFFKEAIDSAEGKVAVTPPAPPKPPKPIEPAVEAKPKTEEPEIVSTPEGKEIFVSMPVRKAEKLSLKKQKAYLAAEVDRAIEVAPDVPDMPRMEVPGKHVTPKEHARELAEMVAKHKVEISTLLGPDKAYVTIRVPGDGEFTIVNEKGFLKRFKDQIKKFPITAKPKGPAAFFGKPRPSTKPTGKRITGEDVEYYNEFKARKQNLIEREPHPNGTPKQSYGDGFFTDGHYAVKLPEKPKTKKPISTGKKAPDIKTVIPTEGLKEAEMMGEFRGPWPDEAATIAHVIAKDGTEIFLNAKYVDSILTKYPKAKPYAVDAKTNVVFKVEEETVGLVMPVRMEMPEFLKARAAEVTGIEPREVVEKPKPEVMPKGEKIAEPDKVRGPDPEGLRQKIYDMLNTELADLQAKGISKGISIRVTQANAIETLTLDGITLRYPGVVKRALGYLPELSKETQRMELISKYIKEGIPRKEAGEKADAEMAVSKEPLSETKSRLLDNIKSEKGSSELINDLSRLGADAIKRGHKSFKAFAIEMKAVLGDAWAKVKHLMQRAYAGSKKILASEKGAWTIKEGKKGALKAVGIEPRLKEGEPLPKRARSIGLESPTGKKVYLDISKEAKGLAVELGLSYPKEVVTHKEIELEADRIMKSDEQLQEVLSKARKEQKLSNPEMLVVRRVNATALETFTDVFKTGKPDEINKKLQTYKEGIFKTTQDLHRQRGQDLNALKIQVQASPDAISNAFAGLKRDLRPQDIDLYDTACKAMKLGNDKPMVSFMKYLEKTKADPELMDYVYEYWYNCILSGVPTHVVNVASNTAWATWQVGIHRPLLAAIDPIVAKFQKRPTEYYLDEVIPMLAGIRKGYKPGKEAAKEIMTKGYTTEASMDKWALDMGKTIGAFARSPNKHLRQIAPFLTIPTKALRAMDVWANQMGYQAELGAICKRMEKQGKGKFEDLMQNPTEEMQKEAAEYAAYTTFMNEPGKLTKWLEKGRDIAPGGRFVMPFVRTIANLTKRGVEMTPGLGIVLGRKATGREVTQVAVKQIEGAMIALALASMVADDRITGNVPADKAEREAFYRQGKLPWAIKIGGRWRQFRRLEPFNGPIAAVAIAHDAWKKTGEVPSTELAFRCTMGIVDNILDSSYLSGLTQVLDSVRRSDTAPQKIANMFDRTVASFSPMSSFQRSFVRAFEAMEGEGAIVRKPKGVAETIKAITPIISREVAAKKNIWGKEVVIPGSPLEQWLPWKAARPTKDVVELEIERLHGKTGLPYPGMPAKYMTVRGERIDLTDKQYDHLLVEGGQAAKKRLDRLVGTGYWKTMSDKEKTARIKRILSDSRKVARSKLKRELGGAVTIPGTGPRYKPKGFVPAAFTGRAFTPAKFEHAGF